jgi:hypothetical protein
VAYNEDLADRIREFLSGQSAVREQRMFGGLSFLVNGKLALSANRGGDLMLRVDPAAVDKLLERGARIAEMGPKRRRMSDGWLVVPLGSIATDADLEFWLAAALDYNRKVTRRA